MTGPEHYREAEEAIEASTWQRQQWGEANAPRDVQKAAYRAWMWEMARAQVHATLALAAATAVRGESGTGRDWETVAI